MAFRLITTPRFERDVRRNLRLNPALGTVLKKIRTILSEDPYNLKHQNSIKKLSGIQPGEGQWRIRSGDYRLRYDIFDKDVVLYTFRHRREAYRRD